MKETKVRKQTLKGSDSQLRAAVSPWVVGQEVHCADGAGWVPSPEPRTGVCPPVS